MPAITFRGLTERWGPAPAMALPQLIRPPANTCPASIALLLRYALRPSPTSRRIIPNNFKGNPHLFLSTYNHQNPSRSANTCPASIALLLRYALRPSATSRRIIANNFRGNPDLLSSTYTDETVAQWRRL